MARGINKVILVGNLGNDPEVKYTQGGMAICTLSVATSSSRKDKDGQQVEKTEWHRVKLFGKLGEIAGEYLKKGRQVYIEGRLEYSTSEKDGVTRYFTDIIGDEMQMLGGNPSEGGGASRSEFRGGDRSASPSRPPQQPQESTPRREAPPAKASDFAGDFSDDDIPF